MLLETVSPTTYIYVEILWENIMRKYMSIAVRNNMHFVIYCYHCKGPYSINICLKCRSGWWGKSGNLRIWSWLENSSPSLSLPSHEVMLQTLAMCVVNVFVRWRFTCMIALCRAVRTMACAMPATTPSARSEPKSSSRTGAPTCCRRTRRSSAAENSALNLTYVLSRCCLVLSVISGSQGATAGQSKAWDHGLFNTFAAWPIIPSVPFLGRIFAEMPASCLLWCRCTAELHVLNDEYTR